MDNLTAAELSDEQVREVLERIDVELAETWDNICSSMKCMGGPAASAVAVNNILRLLASATRRAEKAEKQLQKYNQGWLVKENAELKTLLRDEIMPRVIVIHKMTLTPDLDGIRANSLGIQHKITAKLEKEGE